MTSTLFADPLAPGEWARHPVSLVEEAYRDGWTQRLGGTPGTFPRQLNSGELTAWTRGHAAAHRALACVRPAGEPLRPVDDLEQPDPKVVHQVDVDLPAAANPSPPAAPPRLARTEEVVEEVPVVPQAPTFDGTQLCAQVDPELFFPEKGGDTRPAKRLCGGCEFLDPCRDYAVDQLILGRPIDGVWGATSVLDRRRIRLERAQLLVDQQDELVADVAS